ncbi:dihydrofolate reductase [Litorimonas taeanensis]|uniref:Dihydrofolate reductase n=1 Tax=Litorimonas taeanensis TaxID=568099 RepID=A0A420WL92_9PROT|nr:dihydrofolate reductase [Litorimonas taeanensis]RKQ71676.1 dihydrofolate reductase [Litorimonas taeanensis]
MTANPKLSLIVARAQNGVIGREGDLPWRLPSDLKLFKKTTVGKPVLMGRKTWESLPFPLPGRPNLVLTRDPNYKADKAEVFNDLEAMVGRGYELAGELGVEEVMVIGGAQLYRALMPFIDRQYITQVLVVVEGDAHFTAPSPDEWVMSDRQSGLKTAKDEFDFAVEIWDRK